MVVFYKEGTFFTTSCVLYFFVVFVRTPASFTWYVTTVYTPSASGPCFSFGGRDVPDALAPPPISNAFTPAVAAATPPLGVAAVSVVSSMSSHLGFTAIGSVGALRSVSFDAV